VFGTVVMTRFLSPDVVGEVSVATILCFTASWATNLGWGQYTLIYGRGDVAKEIAWHATIAFVVLGAVALGATAAFGGRLAPWLDAPGAAVYVPGMAVAMWIRRVGMIPERTLTQRMNFRASGLSLFAGEATYTVVSVFLAWRGYGGMSVVYGNIAQSTIMVIILVSAANRADWATPHRLTWTRYKSMVRFGAPLALSGVAHMGARYWDNLTVSRFFGPAATGTYNMAYNLADIPAIQVGEQIQLVLLPSIAELPVEQRARAAERSAALMSLILFPLAVGLGLVAKPLIALALPADQWQEVAPLLLVLSCLSVFRPFLSALWAYMEANGRTARLMWLEIGKLVVLLGGIATLATVGRASGLGEFGSLRLAASAVGISYGATAAIAAIIVSREPHGPRLRAILTGFIQPLVACGVMALAVLAVERGLDAAGIEHPAVYFTVEIVAGAVTYVGAALVVARSSSRDLLGIVKKTLRRGG
jgi:PST family polysaccharide transporter